MTLAEFLKANPKIAVAFSGGTDSAYLLYEAKRAGADVRAYCVHSEFQPKFEREDAEKIADDLGIEMKIIPLSVLGDEVITANPPDRCYYCKRKIMSEIKAAAKADGYEVLADGTNASDDATDRPGTKALSELGIASPLRDCGITKDMVREASKEAGLATWDKPSYACLATRVMTGEKITDAKLRGTEKAETILHDMGFSDLRVRWRGSDGLVQLPEEQIDEGFAREDEIRTALGRIYDYVEIDEKGR